MFIYFCDHCGFRIPTQQAQRYQHLASENVKACCFACETPAQSKVTENPGALSRNGYALIPVVRRPFPSTVSTGKGKLLVFIGPALMVLITLSIFMIVSK